MCSGIRDAAHLSFKLGLVLRGAADPTVLDTYRIERDAHVRHAIGIGWSSASAFIDVFRRAFGHTPGRATDVVRRTTVPVPLRRQGLRGTRRPMRPHPGGGLWRRSETGVRMVDRMPIVPTMRECVRKPEPRRARPATSTHQGAIN
jgi:flavoprotein hydroxylase